MPESAYSDPEVIGRNDSSRSQQASLNPAIFLAKFKVIRNYDGRLQTLF
jgi:hypothetical protein